LVGAGSFEECEPGIQDRRQLIRADPCVVEVVEITEHLPDNRVVSSWLIFFLTTSEVTATILSSDTV